MPSPTASTATSPAEPLTVNASGQLSVHLRSLRKSRSLTQEALGERIGVKQARIADIEKNPGAISVDQLLQILHALDARLLLADAARPAGASADW